MYEFLGITLVLALLLTINATATLAAAAMARACKRILWKCSARTRAEILFVMRIGPPVIAIVAIAVFMIPSYLTYEPYATKETVSLKLGGLAAISAIGVALAFWRGLRSWLATRSLLKQWLANSTQIDLDGIIVPTFVLQQHSFPIIAVVGAIRPRLFIARQVLDSLTEEELAAAIAHEHGHLAAQDNFKRSVMRISRAALLIIPYGRWLDRAWSEASESAADEHAAQRSSHVALNLASALVRIARMIPTGQREVLPAAVSGFLVGDDAPGVRVRVSRLVELASTDPRLLVSSAPLFRFVPWFVLTVVVVVGVTIESRPQVLAAVHQFVEHVVAFLS
ncbi:MAG TPA: M56 family metallopeptidase [Pyrinomonadaceae bacterium]|nr:M56 family metallopeptidase [Pyrinomonadaceae bacterium]